MRYLVLLFAIFALPVFSAEDFTVWESQTFDAPFTDNVIATSVTIANNSGANSIKVHLSYEDVAHGGAVPNVCPCEIYATVEEEIHSGVWIPIANQFESFRILDNSPQRILIYSPALNFDPGNDVIVTLPGGGDLRISKTQGVAPSSFRLRLTVQEYTPGVLDSVTISAYGRKFTE